MGRGYDRGLDIPVYEGVMPGFIQSYVAGSRTRADEEDRQRKLDAASKGADTLAATILPTIKDPAARAQMEALISGVRSGAVDPAGAYNAAGGIVTQQRALDDRQTARQTGAEMLRAAGTVAARPAEDYVIPQSLMPVGQMRKVHPRADDLFGEPTGELTTLTGKPYLAEATPLGVTAQAREAYLAGQQTPALADTLAGSVLKGADLSQAYQILKAGSDLQETRRSELLGREAAKYKATLDAAEKATETALKRYEVKVSDDQRSVVVFDKLDGTLQTIGERPGKKIKSTHLTRSEEAGKPSTMTIVYEDGSVSTDKLEGVPTDLSNNPTGKVKDPAKRAEIIKKARVLITQGKVSDAVDLLTENNFEQNEKEYFVGEAQTLPRAIEGAKAILTKYGGAGGTDFSFTPEGGFTMSTGKGSAYEALKKAAEAAAPGAMQDLEYVDAIYNAIRTGSNLPPARNFQVVPFSASGARLSDGSGAEVYSAPRPAPGPVPPWMSGSGFGVFGPPPPR